MPDQVSNYESEEENVEDKSHTVKVDKYPQIKDDFGWEALEYWVE